MKETDWLQQIKKGNLIAFEKLMDKHSSTIELLASQYGCTPEQARKITEETFKTFLSRVNNLEDHERFAHHLYKIAVEKLTYAHLTESTLKNISLFEEDQQLHEKIVLLEKNEKIAFILSRFHGMKEVEISTILGLPEETIKKGISEAYRYLEEQETKLEKRLEFLEKSYGRIPFSFNKENVFEHPQEENEEAAPTKQPLPKRILLTWAVGIVVLIAFITVPAVTGNEFKTSSDEKYIEKLSSTFEEEVNNILTEAGIVEEIYLGGVLHQIPYGQEAEMKLETLIGELKRRISRDEKIDRKRANEQFEEIISTLELPSTMAERLLKDPLSDDREKSEEFINEFIEKLFMLQHSYFPMYTTYNHIIEGAMVDGKLDIEKLLAEKDSYPEEFQMMIDGMVNQNLDLVFLQDLASFYPSYAKNEFSKQIRDALHEDVGGYMTWIESEPFFYHENPHFTIDESIDFIIEVEATLVKSTSHSQAFDMLYHTYLFMVSNMISSDSKQVFDNKGKVKDEYRNAWKRIAFYDEDSPSSFIMRKIVDEMEASNWQQSETHLKFESHMIDNAYQHAKRGELNAYKIEEDYYERISAFPKDSDYQAYVAGIYEEFSKNHDLSHLESLDPIVVLSIYYLANEREDPVTIWHLLNRDHNPISLDDYVDNWTKGEPLPEEAEMLTVDLRGGKFESGSTVVVYYEAEGGDVIYYFAWFSSHHHHDIWTLQEIPENPSTQ